MPKDQRQKIIAARYVPDPEWQAMPKDQRKKIIASCKIEIAAFKATRDAKKAGAGGGGGDNGKKKGGGNAHKQVQAVQMD